MGVPSVDDAAVALARGEVVVIPTDTVYGLAVAASVPGATRQLFEVKERPVDVALAVLVADEAQAREIAVVSDVASALIARHWPGGLTIVLPRQPTFDVDLGGRDRATVGVRAPNHPIPMELARRVGPLVTTSANKHRRPTPVTASVVAAELGVEVVLDGGPCAGTPSTVVAVRGDEVEVLRQGAVRI